MKKFMVLFLMVIAMTMLVACGGGKKDSRTMSDIIKAYEDSGIEVDKENKPLFLLIDAVDGVMIELEDGKVKIYEYKSEKELEQAQKDYEEMMKDWPANGKFLLESYSEKGTEIFNGIIQ